MTDHQPTREQAERVAQVFELAAEMYPVGVVDMDSSVVRRRASTGPARPRQDHQCETLACHAGWYCNVKAQDETAFKPFDQDRQPSAHWEYLYDGQGVEVTHQTGAQMIASDLGFQPVSPYRAVETLEHWANENPGQWGNEYGGGMFWDSRAFGIQRDDDLDDDADEHEGLDLIGIAAHWRGVATRLPSQQEMPSG